MRQYFLDNHRLHDERDQAHGLAALESLRDPAFGDDSQVNGKHSYILASSMAQHRAANLRDLPGWLSSV